MRKQCVPILLLLLFLLNQSLLAQQYTVSGYVSDSESGETLLSATVLDFLSSKGNVTNSYGYYSLTLPAGKVSLRYSYIGYQPSEISFELRRDTVINLSLNLDNMLEEVTVIATRAETGVPGTQMSAVEVPVAQIRNIPSLFGENDIIKALQLLPGVQSGTEGSAGLYVRGGGPDENLLLLDGVPLYNVNHMMGFFSVFNSDALKNVTLYKGSFPARFGGRLSSVVDIRMKDGNDKEIKGSASIGIIASKFQIEGPLIKERTTFNLSARRTYIDLIAQPFIQRYRDSDGGSFKNAGYYFYDLNAKITHRLSQRDRLYLSAYLGDDDIYIGTRTGTLNIEEADAEEYMNLDWQWGNAVAAIRWNRVVSNKLFMNTTAAFTRYRSSLTNGRERIIYRYPDNPSLNEKTEETILSYRSGISDWTLKSDFDYTPNPHHDIKFGAGYTYHTFSPDVTSVRLDETDDFMPIDTLIGSPRIYAHEAYAFIEDNISLGKVLKFNLGAHFSMFGVQKQRYFSLQPRVGLRLLLSDNLSFKAGYSLMDQYIHMLSNSTISMPTDLWVPATRKIKPMKSHQYAAGFFYSLKNIADFSVEGYYKTMDNLLEYKDGASFMGISTDWEEKVSMGRGVAYGIELLAQRSFGNTTGWIGYTWAKSDRIFDQPGNIINNGKRFPAKYDRRHDVCFTLSHVFSKKVDVSATWVYSTGNAATLGFHEYTGILSPNTDEYDDYVVTHTYVESRNNFRYDDYHRLDVGVNLHRFTRRGNRHTWNLSVYNAYNRLNPFHVYLNREYKTNPATGETVETNTLRQATLFPVMPSISYTFNF